MVDAEDLKSFVSNDVRVRVPPRAPFLWFFFTQMGFFGFFCLKVLSIVRDDAVESCQMGYI